MYIILSIMAVALSVCLPIISAVVVKPKSAKILSIIQLAAASAGVVGIIASCMIFDGYVDASSLEGDAAQWSKDGISSFVSATLVIAGVFLAVTLLGALTDHKMYYPRVILCPVGVLSLILIAPVYALSAKNAAVDIASYIYAIALFETLILCARGAVDDYRLYKGLLAEAADKKLSRRRKRK